MPVNASLRRRISELTWCRDRGARAEHSSKILFGRRPKRMTDRRLGSPPLRDSLFIPPRSGTTNQGLEFSNCGSHIGANLADRNETNAQGSKCRLSCKVHNALQIDQRRRIPILSSTSRIRNAALRSRATGIRNGDAVVDRAPTNSDVSPESRSSSRTCSSLTSQLRCTRANEQPNDVDTASSDKSRSNVPRSE
jgi:hypothetical protein